MIGRSFKVRAGGINLFGPIFLKGEALSEKIGSVKMVIPFFLIKKVECPIQIAKSLSSSKFRSFQSSEISI